MENNNQYQIYEDRNPIIRIFSWIFFSISLFLSSLVLSVAIYISAISDWEISKYYSDNFLDFFLIIFPYLAFILSFLLLIVSLLFFYLAKQKSSFSFYTSIVIIIFSSIFASLIFYYSGLAKKIDSIASDIPLYYHLVGDRNEIWLAPEFGLLSGEIGIITDLNNFFIVDFNGTTWKIESKDPIIKDKSIIETGNKIKIIGRSDQSNTFEAKEIRPY